MNNLVKQSILAGGTFAGGMIAGFLMGSKRTEMLAVFDAAKEKSRSAIGSAKSRREQFTETGMARLEYLKGEWGNTFKDPIPDLYKATESLTLDELELNLPR